MFHDGLMFSYQYEKNNENITTRASFDTLPGESNAKVYYSLGDVHYRCDKYHQV